MIVKAPAKVNLHLEVFPGWNDSYHEIVSIFQMVSVFDIIKLRSLKKEKSFKLEGPFNFPSEDNIISGAVRLFRQATGNLSGVRIEVEKKIPLGGGLGGGSSDAAAVLTCLNRLLETGLTEAELQPLGSVLGSDVPFFLNGTAALVYGRGEKIKKLTPRLDYLLVLVYPGFKINTRDAYSWFDQRNLAAGIEPRSLNDLEKSYLECPVESWNFSNSFQTVLESRYPEIKDMTFRLRDLGAGYSAVSGSGSTVFGLFTNPESAEKAVQAMQADYPLVEIAKPLEKKPSPGLK